MNKPCSQCSVRSAHRQSVCAYKGLLSIREIHGESHKIFIELSDTAKIIGSLNNLGNLHSEMQMDEKALEYYTQAFNFSEQKGGRFADLLTNIGNLLFKTQRI